MIFARFASKCLALVLLGVSISGSRAAESPVISEFMALNVATHDAGDGQFEDWIELYNPLDSEYDLDGHFLTDDPENLRKWAFPGKSLAAGEYLLVIASGKDKKGLFDPVYHTNFTLNPGGGFLAFVAPDGESILSGFLPEYPDQEKDISFGRPLDSDAEIQTLYFENPTPGGPNGEGASSLPERVADTRFSVDRGFYGSPVQLEIST
ncbi:MAG: lamin tail domain-containing protein, partial [Verrucomicrobiota bacterium]